MLKKIKKKLKNKLKLHLTFCNENLAVPEVHTGEVENTDDTEEKPVSILYDNLAMPEIQFVPHKKNGEK